MPSTMLHVMLNKVRLVYNYPTDQTEYYKKSASAMTYMNRALKQIQEYSLNIITS
jgi:hypothetical protein